MAEACVCILTNSSWRSKTLSALLMSEPRSLSMEDDILPNLKSLGLGQMSKGKTKRGTGDALERPEKLPWGYTWVKATAKGTSSEGHGGTHEAPVRGGIKGAVLAG